MRNFNNFINENTRDNIINTISNDILLNFDEWKDMISYIKKIMNIVISIDCEIPCKYYTITNLVSPSSGIYVYIYHSDGRSESLENLSDDTIVKIYTYFKENYDHILTGKDMGLL